MRVVKGKMEAEICLFLASWENGLGLGFKNTKAQRSEKNIGMGIAPNFDWGNRIMRLLPPSGRSTSQLMVCLYEVGRFCDTPTNQGRN